MVSKRSRIKGECSGKEDEEQAPEGLDPSDIKMLKAHSKARTPVSKVAKIMKRTEGSLRQKALSLGIGLGHQR